MAIPTLQSYSYNPSVPLAPSGDAGGDSGGAGIVGGLGAILAATGPIGGIIAGITGALAALGITIKGGTKHYSYDAVLQPAIQFGRQLYTQFAKVYSPSELFEIQKQVPKVWIPLMSQFWGTDGTNGTLAKDITENALGAGQLERQFVLYAIWVGTNVDAEMPDVYATQIRDLFTAIFIPAIRNAGLDPLKLGGNVTVPTPTPIGSGATGPSPIGTAQGSGGTTAGSGAVGGTGSLSFGLGGGNSTLLILGGVALIAFFAMRKG